MRGLIKFDVMSGGYFKGTFEMPFFNDPIPEEDFRAYVESKLPTLKNHKYQIVIYGN